MIPLLWLWGCIVVAPCPDCEPAFDCTDVAIHEPDGGIDACDLAACETCVETCDGDCAIQETYPPRYTCGDAGTWDVYAVCPDWDPDGVYVTDVEDLGCGTATGESLVATAADPGTIDVTHLDYLLGCCPQSVEVDVTASEGTLTVDYTLVDDFCECACMLDVTYTIARVPAGEWTLVAAPSGATTTVSVP